jgi:RNA polymerase sigma-70 factor (ECF subfamily)
VAESSSTDPAAVAAGNGAPSGAVKRELDRAFEVLYREHLRDVYSYCYYRIGNHHDAEDLTEQTFLQAYRHFERARRESDGRPLRPWLIRIAHNLAANYHRDRSRRPTAALDNVEPVEHPHGTERVVEGRERMREVMSGLDRLPDDRREALIMRFSLGMSESRDRPGPGPDRRSDQGADPPRDQAARGGARTGGGSR